MERNGKIKGYRNGIGEVSLEVDQEDNARRRRDKEEKGLDGGGGLERKCCEE